MVDPRPHGLRPAPRARHAARGPDPHLHGDGAHRDPPVAVRPDGRVVILVAHGTCIGGAGRRIGRRRCFDRPTVGDDRRWRLPAHQPHRGRRARGARDQPLDHRRQPRDLRRARGVCLQLRGLSAQARSDAGRSGARQRGHAHRQLAGSSRRTVPRARSRTGESRIHAGHLHGIPGRQQPVPAARRLPREHRAREQSGGDELPPAQQAVQHCVGTDPDRDTATPPVPDGRLAARHRLGAHSRCRATEDPRASAGGRARPADPRDDPQGGSRAGGATPTTARAASIRMGSRVHLDAPCRVADASLEAGRPRRPPHGRDRERVDRGGEVDDRGEPGVVIRRLVAAHGPVPCRCCRHGATPPPQDARCRRRARGGDRRRCGSGRIRWDSTRSS